MGLAALVGILVGAIAMVVIRGRSGQPAQPPVDDARHTLPAGVASVLSVLPSSAVVLDAEDNVLRASTAARAYGGETLGEHGPGKARSDDGAWTRGPAPPPARTAWCAEVTW